MVDHRQPVYQDWSLSVQILLQSNEGTACQVDQEILIASSTFFADLFSIPEPTADNASAETGIQDTIADKADHDQPTEPSTERISSDSASKAEEDSAISIAAEEQIIFDLPIEIDASHEHLRLFVDIMLLTETFSRYIVASTVTVDIKDARALWPLIDKYDCASMNAFLRKGLAALAKNEPWGVLHLASDMDDVDLAKVAISSFSASNIHGGNESSGASGKNWWLQLSKLRACWQLELCRLCIPSTKWTTQYTGSSFQSLTSTLGATFSTDFQGISQRFDPNKLEKGKP